MGAKVGLTARGFYGEGNEALGDIYLISNQVTLGRTEDEIIATVTALGEQLTGMEAELRAHAMKERRLQTEDRIWRAWGLMRCARLLPLNEFYGLWSSLRLGAVLGQLDVDLAVLDTLPMEVQDAHLRFRSSTSLTGAALDAARAERVRSLIRPAGLP